MASKLEHAKALADGGFKIFPIHPGVKAPPCFVGWQHLAGSETGYWGGAENFNIGIHCEGFAVVDVDAKKGGIESFNALDTMMGFPATLKHRTPSGGWHIFYKLPDGHPGVPNSVEALGKGLDIRSAGGYVVAPGSTTEAGEYTVAFDRPIAPAPSWLVQKLGTFTKRERPVITDIPDAAVDVVDRARVFLTTAERSVKGAGGDQTAYRVACQLREQGLSYAQACELMRSEAWDWGCGWREGWLEEKPIASAYKYAQNDPGVKLATAAMFQAAPVSSTIVPKTSTRARTLKEIATTKGRHPALVKGYLRKGTFAQIYGAPGEGKTFIALDLSYCVAAGESWMGCKVKPGPVLYVAYEGSLENRAKALMKKYGEADVPLRVVDATFNLREIAGRQELGAVIAELPEKPVLIVIDTFARAMMGGDENSAQDVGAFTSAIAALIESTGACVLIIHHSGKNKAAGARGSSALLGALDTSIEVDQKQIITDKQREGEARPPIAFALKTLVVGIDEDGDNETSCVVEPSQITLFNRPLTGKGQHAFAILSELTGTENAPVPRAHWVAKLQDEGFSRSSSHEWPRRLKQGGQVTIDGNNKVTRRLA